MKCELCGKETGCTDIVTDDFSNSFSVCSDCKSKFEKRQCISCGKQEKLGSYRHGLCSKCVQVYMGNIEREISEIENGNRLMDDDNKPSMLSEEDLARYLVMGANASSNNQLAKNMWVIVKLMISGIQDKKVISDIKPKLYKILDRSFDAIKDKQCKIVVGDCNSGNVIEKEDNVYIICN